MMTTNRQPPSPYTQRIQSTPSPTHPHSRAHPTTEKVKTYGIQQSLKCILAARRPPSGRLFVVSVLACLDELQKFFFCPLALPNI
jgi:hypothetical protein